MLDIEGDLKYISSAIATDGGSLALILSDDSGKEIQLRLDREMGTQTYDRIYYFGDMLSSKQEIGLLDKLKRLLTMDFKDAFERDIVSDFIKAIESR
jgi:hypothetical protein